MPVTRLHVRHPAVPPVAVAAALAAAAAVVVIADPSETGGLAPCPIRSLTGMWCPGCGLTRATHELFHGEVASALSLNVLTPLVLAGLLTLWFVWYRVAVGAGVPARIRTIRASTYVASGAVLAGFTVVRNLPGADGLRGG